MTKNLGLATDLYQLTMAAGYLANGRQHDVASFELFVRKFPKNRSFLVMAGLQQALEYLQNLRFSEAEISYLKSLPVFAEVSENFFEYLRNFRFSGEVSAMQEGTIFFPNEPILRVTAPLIEAQIVETVPARPRENSVSPVQWDVAFISCLGSVFDSTRITRDSGTTPSKAIVSLAALLCIAVFKASKSGTSIITATRV